MGKISNIGRGTGKLGEGLIVSGSAVNPDGSPTTFGLIVSGSTQIYGDITCNNINIGADTNGTGRAISSGNTDTSLRFNANDGIDLVVGGSFFISCDENASQDTVVINEAGYDIDFRVESDNNPHMFFVDASEDKIGIGTATPTAVLTTSGSISNNYIAEILNGQGSSGHGLKIQSYGNGSSTYLLDVEAREGKQVLIANADGQVGIGNVAKNSIPAILTVKQHASNNTILNIKDSNDNAIFKIDSDGKPMVADYLYHSGDLDTYIGFPGQNQINLVANGHSFLKYDGNIKINNANRDRDTQIMADDGNVVLHVDAGTNSVGVNTTSPISELDVAGKIAITAEMSTPSQPADGQGYLYTKSDGKIYWRSYDVSEVDLTAGGGGGGDIAENVITGASNLSLTSSNNRDTIIITPLSGDVTYTLPDPTANFKVKFLAATNWTGGDVIFKTKQSSQKIFGMIYRVSYGGDSETGWDNSPTSYAGDTAAKFVGGASEEHKNTITLVNALQGSDIDFYSDGTYWYVRGTIVAVTAGNVLAATTTFSYESY